MKIKLSKSQWNFIGKKAGWIKKAGGYGPLSGDVSDVLEAQVMIKSRENKNDQIILQEIINDPQIMSMIMDEVPEMDGKEISKLISELIKDTKMLYKL